MADALKLAIVTDIHHGADTGTKRGSAALPLLRRFIAFADDWGPDAVLDLGDRISDVDAATDRALMAEVAAAFEAVRQPRYHLLGNHDVAYLSVDENAGAFGSDLRHRSVVVNGWRLVFWQADTFIHRPQGFRLRPSDLDWLRAELAASAEPVLLFSHVPLGGGSMVGNYYFQENPQYGGYLADGAAIRRVIADSSKVKLCAAGHVHWNALHTVDGIPFLSLQSLTETCTTGEPAAAWSTLEIAAGEVLWHGHGLDGVVMTLRLPKDGERWTGILAPFDRRPKSTRVAGGIEGVGGFILDMDGVLNRGDQEMPGAAAFMAELARARIPHVLLTNNARATPEGYAAKLRRFGISVAPEQILTSGMITAAHLVRAGASSAVAFGPAALHEALSDAGLAGSDRPDVVVVGIDDDLSVRDLRAAARLAADGARIMVTNPDPVVPGPAGSEPETGSVRAFLEIALGRPVESVGKPHRLAFDLARDRLGLPAERVVVVGDSLETDIAGAVAAGMRSVLVDTGNRNELRDGGPHPTVQVADLTELTGLLTRKAA
ncbi:MAG: HAD-IIA family hydrolase [Parvibaculum sp.]